jgi:tight adherence protein C
MDFSFFLILVVIFSSVAVSTVLVMNVLATRDAERSATDVSGQGNYLAPAYLTQLASSTLLNLGASVRPRLHSFIPNILSKTAFQDSVLQQKLEQAGYRRESAVPLFLGITLCSVVLSFAASLLIATGLGYGKGSLSLVLVALVGLGVGVLLPVWSLHALIRRRQREILEHFPDALDLIRICLEAGLGLDAALQRVGHEIRRVTPALCDEINVLGLELRAGAGRQQALQRFAQRTSLADIRAWVGVVLQAEKFGTGIAQAVKIHSDQLRQTRTLNAEERAATLSTKLLFPLIFCIFPALLLVLLGPAAIVIQEQLAPTSEVRASS